MDRTASPPERSSSLAIEEIVQALKARAGFETLFPTGPTRDKVIEFVARLRGEYPDAYDILAMGVWLEHNRSIKDRAMSVLLGTSDGFPKRHDIDWKNVTRHELLRGLEDLTVSMRGGKGRKEGVDISKTTPVQEGRSRWSWRKEG